jgi:monoterpene epsilon-lactone hydrolase
MPSLRSHIFRRFVQRTMSGAGHGRSLQETRANVDARAERGIHLPKGATSRTVMAAAVPSIWIEPRNTSSSRAILYLHGGGYTICSPATHRGLAGRIALAGDSRVLLIAYRLAPEHPFPAALEDALSAYRWLLEQGISPNQIAIGGDSAGGGLTLATAVSLRDADDPLPAALFLISPWTDLTFSGESVHTRAKADPMLRPDGDGSFARLYTGEHRPDNPLISPLFADLRGLPPTLIQVGNNEILLSDSTRLEEKLKAAGVDTRLEVWDGMWHVFQVFAPWVPEANRAIRKIGQFIREKTKP